MNKKSVKMNSNFCENMKIIIFLPSIALVSATQVNPSPRSVNVALETSFLFDPKDMNDNKSLVNNIRGFLDKLYKILGPQTPEKQFRTETKPRMQEETKLGEFIEVLQNIGQNFLNMTAPKIKEALDTIHVEVKNISEQKQQSILSQVLPNRTQVIIKDVLDTWMHSKPEEIKIFINSIVRENKPLLIIFARKINTYYNDAEVKKLNKILKKFRRYIDNNKDTTKIVKKLLHNTIFKKYDNLNESARAAVVRDLKMLSEFLIAKHSISETRRKSPSHERVEKAEFPDDITYTALRRSIDEKIRHAREKDEAKKKANKVVVGHVELYIEPPQNS